MSNSTGQPEVTPSWTLGRLFRITVIVSASSGLVAGLLTPLDRGRGDRSSQTIIRLSWIEMAVKSCDSALIQNAKSLSDFDRIVSPYIDGGIDKDAWGRDWVYNRVTDGTTTRIIVQAAPFSTSKHGKNEILGICIWLENNGGWTVRVERLWERK